MAVVMNGITLAAVERYIRGPGGLYKDFTDVDTPGTLLGETRGDAEFDPGITFHDTDVAGAFGKMKAHRKIARYEPKLTVALLEATTTNLGAVLPGFDSADETPTKQVENLGVGTDIDSPGVALTGGADVDSSTLEIWYGTSGGGASTKAVLNTDYSFTPATGTVIRLGGSSIGDADEVTAYYEYDSTGSGDAFTVFTPGQIANADYWTNVTLVCQLTSSTYSNPYFVLQLKNVLNTPSALSIPGDGVTEAVLQMTFEAFFNPDTGTTIAYAPFEWWVGRA